jgi:hypothetical protein
VFVGVAVGVSVSWEVFVGVAVGVSVFTKVFVGVKVGVKINVVKLCVALWAVITPFWFRVATKKK